MPISPARNRPSPRADPRPRRRAILGLALAATFAVSGALATGGAVASTDPTRHGAPPMPEPESAPLLTHYFEGYLRDQDVEGFRLKVVARYTEGSLARLARSPSAKARRAAVLALGLVGSYEANAAVARALRDPDSTVRNLANSALWAIWFRADSPENNATLEEVHDLINRRKFADAEDLATRLIARSPKFAEAHNQRADRPLLPGPLRRERRGLPTDAGAEPLPHRRPGRPRPVLPQARTPRRGPGHLPPRLEAPALQRGASRDRRRAGGRLRPAPTCPNII